MLHKFHVECWQAKLLPSFSFVLIMVLNLSLDQMCRDLVIWKRESYLLIPYLFVHWSCKIVKYYIFLIWINLTFLFPSLSSGAGKTVDSWVWCQQFQDSLLKAHPNNQQKQTKYKTILEENTTEKSKWSKGCWGSTKLTIWKLYSERKEIREVGIRQEKHHTQKESEKGCEKRKVHFFNMWRGKTISKETQIFSMDTLYFGELPDIICYSEFTDTDRRAYCCFCLFLFSLMLLLLRFTLYGSLTNGWKTSVLSFTISQVGATELLQKTTSCSEYETLKTGQTHKIQYLDWIFCTFPEYPTEVIQDTPNFCGFQMLFTVILLFRFSPSG